jgi:AraC-like DNA-binding protein
VTSLNILSTVNIGFSLVAALILAICYVFFLQSSNKSNSSVITAIMVLSGIGLLQFEHLDFMISSSDPLQSVYYRALLFIIPPLFYFFSRFALFAGYQFKLYSVLHFLPFLTVFFLDKYIAVPAAFLIGTSYCLWLAQIIYSLRNHRKRFELEFFFFAFFSILAILVLVFGFSMSFIDNAYFYHFYSNGIALAFMLVTAAFIIYPNLLDEISEVVKLSYTNSTLNNIDVEKSIIKLNDLMLNSKLYQDENLSLATLAEVMQLSTHQLSEMINTQFGMSFSKYIRELRVERAKDLLKSEPNSSILSISMETGFKSQSNFYAAFKDITGESPGSYRKSLS